MNTQYEYLLSTLKFEGRVVQMPSKQTFKASEGGETFKKGSCINCSKRVNYILSKHDQRKALTDEYALWNFAFTRICLTPHNKGIVEKSP